MTLERSITDNWWEEWKESIVLFQLSEYLYHSLFYHSCDNINLSFKRATHLFNLRRVILFFVQLVRKSSGLCDGFLCLLLGRAQFVCLVFEVSLQQRHLTHSNQYRTTLSRIWLEKVWIILVEEATYVIYLESLQYFTIMLKRLYSILWGLI